MGCGIGLVAAFAVAVVGLLWWGYHDLQRQEVLWEAVEEAHEQVPLPPNSEAIGGSSASPQFLLGSFCLDPRPSCPYDFRSMRLPSGTERHAMEQMLAPLNASRAVTCSQPPGGRLCSQVYRAREGELVDVTVWWPEGQGQAPPVVVVGAAPAR
jgi:hypothetical protein